MFLGMKYTIPSFPNQSKLSVTMYPQCIKEGLDLSPSRPEKLSVGRASCHNQSTGNHFCVTAVEPFISRLLLFQVVKKCKSHLVPLPPARRDHRQEV